MSSGKWLFRILIALAILAGVIADCLFHRNVQWIGDLFALYEYDSSYGKKRDAAMASRFPKEPALLHSQDADFYLDLFNSHPDRPWYLLRWFHAHPDLRNMTWRDTSGLPLSGQESKAQQQAAKLAAIVQTLRERDPDNGYPLLLQAWLEAKEGTAVSQKDPERPLTAEVVDAERAAKAVALLRQAIAQKRFTVYGRETGAEWLRILGEPETFAEAMLSMEQLAGLPIPLLFPARDIALRLIAEARRRAEKEGQTPPDSEAEETAYEILHDLQTMGAHLALGDPTTLISVMIGYSVIEMATDGGAAVLNDAGQPENASRLLARGRKMQRPLLLARLMSFAKDAQLQPGSKALENFPLADDPELIKEAESLLALRMADSGYGSGIDFSASGDLSRAGYVLAIMFPNMDIHTPWTKPVVTLEELKSSAHFEHWGMQKILTAAFLVLAGIALLVMLALYAWQSLTLGKTAPPEWPSLRRMIVGGVLFGVLAAGPGLLAALAGNFLWQLTPAHCIWQCFWNVWGLLAACWALAFWICARSGGERRTQGTKFWLWLALAGLLTSVICACLIYSGVLTTAPTVHRKAVIATLAILLLPMPIWGVAAILRWIVALFARKANNAPDVPGLRLFLAAWAGGILLWLASYCVVDLQERKWGERDTLIAPRLSAIAFSPIEARLIDVHVQNMERALATDDR